MKNSKESKHNMHRRDFIKGGAAVSLGLTSGLLGIHDTFSQTNKKRNAIQLENAKPGTRDWMLTKTDVVMNEPVELWRSPRIEGYCSETSVAAGETLKVMVSTNPVSEFDLEIFRTGYYGGTGGRFMKKFTSIPGKIQLDPEIGENRLRECKWEPSVEFEIPDDWLSGVYLGKLTAKEGGVQSYVIFIVRDDRPCDLLFQCSDMTWQTYNSWPTNEWSLYHNDANGHTGVKGRKKWSTDQNDTGWVSFDRPYGQFCQDHLMDRPNSVGSGEFLLWEFPLSFWIEQQGYDVSYISNVDTHKNGPRLQKTKGFISIGHDEYWTLEMYENVMAARDVGVNLAFLSGNSVWGVVPLLPSAQGQDHRVMRRQGVFVGDELYEMFLKMRKVNKKYPAGPDGALLMGGRQVANGIHPYGGDWVCSKPDHWVYEGTGMKEGDAVKGIIGWEWHDSQGVDLPGHVVVAKSIPALPNGKTLGPHSGTFYNGPKGNFVFSAGSIWWAQGLSSPPGHVFAGRSQGPDPRLQRMMANVFDRFIK